MDRKVVKGCPSTMGDDVQLNTTTLIRHAARTHGDQQIVFRTPDGGWDHYTYGECYRRGGRGGKALHGPCTATGERRGGPPLNRPAAAGVTPAGSAAAPVPRT